MPKTKLIIALIAAVAINVLAVGVVFGHYTTSQASPYSNDSYSPNTGFAGWLGDSFRGFGAWLGGCFRGYNQPYPTYPPTPTPNPDPDTTEQPQTPLQPQQPYPPPRQDYYPPRYPDQGYYPRGYKRGCWGW